MIYNMITTGMDGAIKANTVHYKYDNQNYTGACFTITLKIMR